MSRRRRDRVVVLSLVGVLIVGALIAVAISSGWLWFLHYWRLQSDPSRLEAMIMDDEPEKLTAVKRFVRATDAGKQALLLLYLDEFQRAQGGINVRKRMREDALKANHGTMAFWSNGCCYAAFRKKGCTNSFSTFNIPESTERRKRIADLIDACVVDVPLRFPNEWKFEYIFQRSGEEDLYTPNWSGDGSDVTKIAIRDPRARHYCFFRILP